MTRSRTSVPATEPTFPSIPPSNSIIFYSARHHFPVLSKRKIRGFLGARAPTPTPIHPNPRQSTPNTPQIHLPIHPQSTLLDHSSLPEFTPNAATSLRPMHRTYQPRAWMRCVYTMIHLSRASTAYTQGSNTHFFNLSPLVTCTNSCSRSGNCLH